MLPIATEILAAYVLVWFLRNEAPRLILTTMWVHVCLMPVAVLLCAWQEDAEGAFSFLACAAAAVLWVAEYQAHTAAQDATETVTVTAWAIDTPSAIEAAPTLEVAR